MKAVEDALDQADVLVLNGDIFDFRWSTLDDHHATVQAALAWLGDQLLKRPTQEIHFVLGNHDCLDPFVEALDVLAKETKSLHNVMKVQSELNDVLTTRVSLHGKRLAKADLKFELSGLMIGALVVQIAYGGLVAGLKAGHVSDTWPFMLGQLVPAGLLSKG